MLKLYLIRFTISVAKRVAKIPAQIRSGLVLINRSMIAQAERVSPRKVRFSHIKGFEPFANELISINRTLLSPRISTRAKQSRNIISNRRLILKGDFINLYAGNNLINA
jgi:hypothetical protein